MRWQQQYFQKYYQSRPGWVDGTIEFCRLCASVIGEGAEILEIGAGPSNRTSRLLADLGTLHGLDVDPAVRDNDALATAHVLTGERFPLEDESVDACVSNYVLEHIADPDGHLAEVRRVLRGGGVYVFRTPNLFHYTGLIGYLTPHWLHERLANRLRRLPDDSHDPYPTLYRMNSRHAIRAAARREGFTVEGLYMIEKAPSYGQASRVLFFTFMAYERLVNSAALFSCLRANIFGVLRKPR